MRKLYLRFLCWCNAVCFKHQRSLKFSNFRGWYCPDCSHEEDVEINLQTEMKIRLHKIEQDKLIERIQNL